MIDLGQTGEWKNRHTKKTLKQQHDPPKTGDLHEEAYH